MVEVVLEARNDTVARLIEDCADGNLPFDGPGSLYSKMREMGYSTTSLFEMVCDAKANRPRYGYAASRSPR